MGDITVLNADCREAIKDIADNSVDACVTDPPYALVSIGKRFGKDGAAPAKDRDGLYKRASAGFMGQKWDTGETAFDPAFWREVYRVLKPGAHVVAFSGTRTYHRMACAIEDAGFEIRDALVDLVQGDTAVVQFMATLCDVQAEAWARCLEESGFGGMLAWIYGSGFPKSHDISKALDKMAGAERRVVAEGAPVKRMIPGADQHKGGWEKNDGRVFVPTETAPATDEAVYWDGWGTALKPALEPICFARKPITESSIARNVLKHGTGALNIDGCRIESECETGWSGAAAGGHSWDDSNSGLCKDGAARPVDGRWPANVVHDGSDEVLAAFPAVGNSHPPDNAGGMRSNHVFGADRNPRSFHPGFGDSGSAARFFYSAKADAEDRLGSKHPTVKPIQLMRWLVRLITPPGGLVLDPFAGSGTTGVAALAEGMRAVLIERDPTFAEDIRIRARHASGQAGHSAQIKQRNREARGDMPLFANQEAGG